MVRLLSWNVRGLNDSAKRAMLRNVLSEWNCDLVCLQETKLEDIELTDVQSIWKPACRVLRTQGDRCC